ncbi:MAG: hypothetical protein L0241_22095, partial [Planctomycetia bacterium]|nr:hypothetical protein [Planctomycetia bacterium]
MCTRFDMRTHLSRVLGASVAVALFFWTRHDPLPAAAQASPDGIRAFAQLLLREYPDALDESSRTAIAAALNGLRDAAKLPGRIGVQPTGWSEEEKRNILTDYDARTRQIARELAETLEGVGRPLE